MLIKDIGQDTGGDRYIHTAVSFLTLLSLSSPPPPGYVSPVSKLQEAAAQLTDRETAQEERKVEKKGTIRQRHLVTTTGSYEDE